MPRNIELFGAKEFLNKYPNMSFGPFQNGELILQGRFRFKAKYKDFPEIDDSYKLKIQIPNDFPYTLPKVVETCNKIPHTAEFHVNSDKTLCVCNPIRLILKLGKSPKINGYVRHFLIPYLYAVSYKLQYGGKFIYGELAHGFFGLVLDYCDIFEVCNYEQVKKVLYLLTIDRKKANQCLCPCQCGKRLSECKFNLKLSKFRRLAPKSYYKHHLLMIS